MHYTSPKTLVGTCETCKETITLTPIEGEPGQYQMEHSPTCVHPRVSMITANPRKLGVITGITGE